jgi:hypothetical protein
MTNTPSASLPPLYSFDQVVQTYGLSMRSLMKDAYAKKFEHTHIGSSRYFTAEQLAAFLNARKITAMSNDGLDAVRDRLARRRARRPTSSQRSAA